MIYLTKNSFNTHIACSLIQFHIGRYLPHIFTYECTFSQVFKCSKAITHFWSICQAVGIFSYLKLRTTTGISPATRLVSICCALGPLPQSPLFSVTAASGILLSLFPQPLRLFLSSCVVRNNYTRYFNTFNSNGHRINIHN